MKKILIIIASLLVVLASTLMLQNKNESWVKTYAEVKCSKEGEHEYECTIKYNANESTAVNNKGEKIQEEIEQFFISDKDATSEKLMIKYQKEEPIIFEIIK